MEESELEEGEACSYNHNDGDNVGSLDPDMDLSYIDEKIHDVLGHFQRDFEGGVCAENLGAKFGGYGSFLPTYQRSPIQSHSKTPLQAQNCSRSQNDIQVEQEHTSLSNVPKTVRPGPATSRVMPLSASEASSLNDLGEQKSFTKSSGIKKSAEKKSSVLNKQNSLKFRLKVVSDNLFTENKAAIYNGLGLDDSPSLSVDNSPSKNEENYSEHQKFLLESPTSILMVMTSLPLDRDLLLSPLCDDLVQFAVKEKALIENKKYVPVSRKAIEKEPVEKKLKSTDRFDSPLDKFRCNRKNSRDGIDVIAEKETGTDTSFPSVCDTAKGKVNASEASETLADVVRGRVVVSGEMGLLGPDDPTRTVFDENLRTSSAGSIQENTKEARKGSKYEGEKKDSIPFNGKKASKDNPDEACNKQKAKQKDKNDEQDCTKFVKEREHQLSGGKTELKEIQKFTGMGTKNNNQADMKSQKKANKVEETYKTFFGDMVDSEGEEAEDQTSSLEMKDSHKSGKRISATENASERLRNKKTDGLVASESHTKATPSVVPSSSSRPHLNASHAISNSELIQENWVGCDKCEKWRLLPLGVLPKNLPENWICSMLNWLPGKINCDVPEEETNATMVVYQVRAPDSRDIIQNNPVNPEEGATKRRKKGSTELTYETEKEGPAMQTSARNGNFNHPSATNLVAKLAVQRDKYKHNEKTKAADRHSDGGKSKSSKMKSKRNDDEDKEIMLSKKMKMESYLFSDEEHGGATGNGHPSSSSGMPATSAGTDWAKSNGLPKESQTDKKHWLQTPAKKSENDGSSDVGNSDEFDKVKRKRIKGNHDTQADNAVNLNEHLKEKKARASENEGEHSSLSKGNHKSERKIISSKKRNFGNEQNSAVAASSSSKLSDSQQPKTSFHEAKNSPVESVSSSPMRILDPVKDKRRKKNERDANFHGTAGSKRYSDGEDDGVTDRLSMGMKDKNGPHKSSVLDFQGKDFGQLSSKAKEQIDPSLDIKNHKGNGSANDFLREDQTYNEERRNNGHQHSNGSRPEKRGKSLSGQSNNKDRSKRSSLKGDPGYIDKKKSKGKSSGKNSKIESRGNLGEDNNHETEANTSTKPNMPFHLNGERNSKRSLSETSDKKAALPEKEIVRPSSTRIQDDTHAQNSLLASTSKKVGKVGVLAGDTSQVDLSRLPIQMKKNDTLGSSLQNGHSPSPLRRELPSNQAANNALKEATDLKHIADRLKKSGSNLEMIGLYFQACVKFLYGASLLEACSTENASQGEMLRSMNIYSTTAKLCGYCGHEYERLKEMAAAALAYKCMEVAYMRVVYSSHTSTNRYRHELQACLQMGPPGESPSSSASDVDNLIHTAAAEKVGTLKGINSPQVGGNHIISAQNRPNLLRVLQFAQNVTSAMDASRKSRIACAAANGILGGTQHGEVISSIQRALDYTFQDVQGFLRLIRLAMEAINH